MPETLTHHYPPIGVIRTCFTEKFGIPRQSLMVDDALGVIRLNRDPGYRVALNHLSLFSHLWILFVFDRQAHKAWRPTIRPPRLDAPRRVGVFASRSPGRPNPIGLSAVKLERIDLDAPEGIEIHVSGVDIMDGSPVLDIKPYLPFADRIPEANGGWADSEIKRYRVTFSAESLSKLAELSSSRHPRFQNLISQMLEWDPRPTSQRRAMPIEAEQSQGMEFAFRILDVDVRWRVVEQAIHVVDLVTGNSPAL